MSSLIPNANTRRMGTDIKRRCSSVTKRGLILLSSYKRWPTSDVICRRNLLNQNSMTENVLDIKIANNWIFPLFLLMSCRSIPSGDTCTSNNLQFHDRRPSETAGRYCDTYLSGRLSQRPNLCLQICREERPTHPARIQRLWHLLRRPSVISTFYFISCSLFIANSKMRNLIKNILSTVAR